MGTKNNPGKFDCYAKADPDEPIFVLRANDPLAPFLVDAWAKACASGHHDPAKVVEARDCAQAMRNWQAIPRTEPTIANVKRIVEGQIKAMGPDLGRVGREGITIMCPECGAPAGEYCYPSCGVV